MRVKTLFVLFVFLCLSCLEGKTQSWISIDSSKSGECFSISILESNESVYRAKISLHGFYDKVIQKDGNDFHLISFNIPASTTELGNPNLPVINQLFALPFGDTISVSLKKEIWDSIEIGKIFPSQDLLYEEFPEDAPFKLNYNTYSAECFSPFLTKTGELQKWKGIPNRIVTICPFKYYPRRNCLSILKEFEICVNYVNIRHKPSCISGNLGKFANANILNNIKNQQTTSRNSSNYDYLIIAGNIANITSCQAMKDFCKWKAFKGLKTKVVTTSTTGSSASLIKEYIAAEKETCDISYVLFVGDYDKIPLVVINDTALHYGMPIKGDYWYTCLDGNNDVQADIPIGRIPTNSITEFTSIVEKTIRYESTPISYYNKALLVAGYNQSYSTCMESVRTATYNTPFSFTKEYGGYPEYGGNEATNSDILSQINSNFNIVNYRGHGIENAWGESEWGWNTANEYFYGSYVNQLGTATNSIYLNVACLTGDITNNQCMMKSFLFSDRGATFFLGATNIALKNAGNSLNISFYDNLLNENIKRIGDCLLESHLQTITNLGIYGIVNAYLFLCGGDPSLELWTTQPQTFEIASININGNYVNIVTSSTQGYKANFVSANGEVLNSTNSTGNYTSVEKPTSNGYIVLTKSGYIPYVINVNATDSNIQNVSFDNGCTIYLNTPIYIGYDVTASQPYGSVSIGSGSKVIISKGQGVSITKGFECQTGGTLEIK